MTRLNKKSDWKPITAGAVVGGVAGGTGFNLLSQLLWKKPSKTQKIIMSILGASAGAVTGASLTSSLGARAESGAQDAAQNAADIPKQIIPSLFGIRPNHKEWRQMSPLGRALHGGTQQKGLPGLIGDIIWWFKRGSTGINDQYPGLGITSQLTGATAGGILGSKYTDSLLRNNARRKQLLSELQSIKALEPSKAAKVDSIRDILGANDKFKTKLIPKSLQDVKDIFSRTNWNNIKSDLGLIKNKKLMPISQGFVRTTLRDLTGTQDRFQSVSTGEGKWKSFDKGSFKHRRRAGAIAGALFLASVAGNAVHTLTGDAGKYSSYIDDLYDKAGITD